MSVKAHKYSLKIASIGAVSLVLILTLCFGCVPEKTESTASSDAPSVKETPKPQSTPAVAQTPTRVKENEASVESQEANAIIVQEDRHFESDRSLPPTTGNRVGSVQSALNSTLAQQATGSHGSIFIENTVYDFGELSPKDIPTGQFKIKNIGEGLLHITNVKVCCGAQHTLDKDTLAPDEVATLDLKYHTPGVGPFEKYITVFCDDPKTQSVRLTIKGEVIRKLDWTPKRFQLFLDQGNGGCQPLKIKSLDGQPFALTSFKSTNDALTFEVDPNKEATEFTITPTVDLDTLRGLEIGKGMVYISHTHPGSDRIAMPYDVRPRYGFTPHTFLIFNASPDVVRTQRVNVIDNYADTLSVQNSGTVNAASGEKVKFKIESVTVEKKTAKLLRQSDIKGGYQLEFQITPPPPAGSTHFIDRITIKLSTGDEINIPINGIYSTKLLSESGQQPPIH